MSAQPTIKVYATPQNTIDIEHQHIHDFSHFFASDTGSATGAAPSTWLLYTPTTPNIHLTYKIGNATAGLWAMYEDTTLTGGTSGSAVTTFNNYRLSSIASNLLVYRNPTTGSLGTRLSLDYVGTTGQGASRPGAAATRETEIVLKTGSFYSFRFTPDAGTVICSINFQWYET